MEFESPFPHIKKGHSILKKTTLLHDDPRQASWEFWELADTMTCGQSTTFVKIECVLCVLSIQISVSFQTIDLTSHVYW